jgi:serine/threonine protein kinase
MPLPSPRNAVALVVGIGAYQNPTRVPTLRYAARDARALARVLAAPDVCAFPEERVVVLTNRQAHRAELVRRLSSWLPAQGQGADLALIYFAGHGIVHKVGGRDEGYLLPHDADADHPVAHGIAMSDLAKWIEDVNARAVVVCLDCCHAGYLPQEGVSLRGPTERDMEIQPSLINQLSGKGRFLIASCDRGQKSIEAEELRHGLFTYHLLKGLIEAGDRDGDGKVSVAELFGYVSSAVSRDARERFGREQTPWTSATYTEEVILSAVRPARTTVKNAVPPTVQGEDAELLAQLAELRRRPDPLRLPFVFRHLAHSNEIVRNKARQALRALTWDKVGTACEQVARASDDKPIGDVLDGLAALEAREEVASLLDRLAGALRGASRDRAVWLLDRKRLALERERLAAVFREKQSSYEIVKVLGPGLYTGAYLARQELTGLEVVVRVLRPEYAGQPLVRSHFLDLATRAVRLVHQNLVLTREVRAFADSGLYFAVRDYVDGPTLREVLASGKRFEPAQAIKILRQVIDALTPLHCQDLPHAGIRPSNVFLTRNDHVFLGDPSIPVPAVGFDLPRLAYDFRYAPPELFHSPASLTPASDLYSLGCLAHELLRGQPPFVSDSPFELIARHERDAVATVGDAFDGWLAKLLAKSPADRFGSLGDALAALGELEDAPRPGKAKSLPTLAAAVPELIAPTVTFSELDAGAATSLPAEPPSVHLLNEQSLAAFEGRESIVPLTHGGGPASVLPEDRVPGSPLPPDVIPGYEILETIGRGGMGVVYRARQKSLDRVVAIKVILSGLHAGRDEMRRFRTEAEAIARLQHPNILQVFELGEQNGQPFMVMEYCGGGSLADQLRGTLPTAHDAARLVQTLAFAMQYAHEKKIVHRDLKPGNVLLTDDGTPKISDFGLAKLLDNDGTSLTHTGAILGTPAYLAPEQATGSKNVGPWTDTYALGAILYQALTGRPPFEGTPALETLNRVVSEAAPPPRRLVASVPRELEAIALRCLQKEPAKRYASAQALADELGRFLDGAFSVQQTRGRRWWPFG